MIFQTFQAMYNGQMCDFKVYMPNVHQQREAQKVRNTVFQEALLSKAILKAQLNTIMRDRGLWNDEKEAQYNTLAQEICDNERKLEEGGIYIEDARKIAIKLRKLRADQRILIAEKLELNNTTAEGQADNQSFNYLVYACTFLVYNNTEKQVWKSFDEYLEAGLAELPIRAATTLSGLLYGFNSQQEEKRLAENAFLSEYGFVDDKLRLINKDGHLIDEDGRLITEDGYYVNESGDRVDINGIKIDNTGHYIFERKPFLDSSGNPIEKVVIEKTE
jgi:hypothetical protein